MNKLEQDVNSGKNTEVNDLQTVSLQPDPPAQPPFIPKPEYKLPESTFVPPQTSDSWGAWLISPVISTPAYSEQIEREKNKHDADLKQRQADYVRMHQKKVREVQDENVQIFKKWKQDWERSGQPAPSVKIGKEIPRGARNDFKTIIKPPTSFEISVEKKNTETPISRWADGRAKVLIRSLQTQNPHQNQSLEYCQPAFRRSGKK